jgi:DNA polymerase-3 subunit epsilon
VKSQSLSELEYIVFDTETTGLYANEGDEVIEIGAVRVRGLEIMDEIFQSMINPGRNIPEASTQVHGITDRDVKGAPSIDAVIGDFRKFCGSAIWVAQNARFDLSFLVKVFERKQISYSQQLVIDTIGLSKMLFPYETRHNLDVIMARLGIAKTGDRHRSVDDSRYTAKVLIEFIQLLDKQGIKSLQEIQSALIRLDNFQKPARPKTASLF